MRGGIDGYDANAGSGTIFGEDGNRYAFSRETLQDFEEISIGIPVLFDHDGTRVTEAMVQSGWSPSKPRVRYEAISEQRGLGPVGYYAKCLILFFSPSGRAQRVEFWSFHIVNFSMIFALQLATIFAGGPSLEQSPFMMAAFALFLLTVIPTVTLAARRVHDAGFDTVFLLIVLLPIIGWLILLCVLWFAPSQRHTNKYGRHPKGVSSKAEAQSVPA